jgi:hypothetical protein
MQQRRLGVMELTVHGDDNRHGQHRKRPYS